MDISFIKNHLRRLYFDRCTVIEFQQVTENNITHVEEVEVYSNIPCHLSHSTAKQTSRYGNTFAFEPTQITKLSLAPELEIKAGSKIIVTRHGRSTVYKNSGKPSVFSSHQEITLELDDDSA